METCCTVGQQTEREDHACCCSLSVSRSVWRQQQQAWPLCFPFLSFLPLPVCGVELVDALHFLAERGAWLSATTFTCSASCTTYGTAGASGQKELAGRWGEMMKIKVRDYTEGYCQLRLAYRERERTGKDRVSRGHYARLYEADTQQSRFSCLGENTVYRLMSNKLWMF